ncbi:Uncharacterised protein [Mycobacteroides abscessus]|nr:hypothetical protein MM1S1510930_5792 [Mycobacteroides abscessus subsp. bolletii 1S-151-0930]EIU67099.1 hypothetical protein MM1S1520914_1012 [Mycobacteroides abscessus subsp. bolletii 1S-152-0914]EIV16790.1 hypothetical protein MM2B0912R_1034 [Mycobacteroides abscessus subsp. bolletii 2B-0912-R]EIV28575.1 hypothetical protein MM2B0912S_0634 [Mycobacteroides abscessus subsp. bolletii 2B-0912-S]EIV82528.1 hypothetical protein MM2B1231_0694 [Mycobacteroides abscessus subsp. bolletii 2B-1231]C
MLPITETRILAMSVWSGTTPFSNLDAMSASDRTPNANAYAITIVETPSSDRSTALSCLAVAAGSLMSQDCRAQASFCMGEVTQMWQPTGRHIGLIQEDQLPQILDAAVPVVP